MHSQRYPMSSLSLSLSASPFGVLVGDCWLSLSGTNFARVHVHISGVLHIHILLPKELSIGYLDHLQSISNGALAAHGAADIFPPCAHDQGCLSAGVISAGGQCDPANFIRHDDMRMRATHFRVRRVLENFRRVQIEMGSSS